VRSPVVSSRLGMFRSIPLLSRQRHPQGSGRLACSAGAPGGCRELILPAVPVPMPVELIATDATDNHANLRFPCSPIRHNF
jgi:hypothetical protein